ncbi:MAG: MarR family winged helix-turn-helix transcriptional regulator [Gammaproteobacteria bacterium]|nr:MarR family winged helix-turn-helix transcriptional regulator [Gammaproteobacteria bacterium]
MAANANTVAPRPDDALERGELDQMLGIALIRAHNGAYKYFYKSMDKDMKPGFYTSLSLIQRNPGLTQKALAEAIQRDPSTIVPILDAFEKKGWIERRRSETDRRAHALYLTPAGKTAARRFDRKVGDIEAQMQAHLGKERSRELRALLKDLEAFFAAPAD